MRKRLIAVILICIAGIVTSSFVFNDIDTAKNSLEYTHETLMGNIDAAEGLDLDISTSFGPGDIWNSRLSIKDGKFLQSNSYEYGREIEYDYNPKIFVASLYIEIGDVGLGYSGKPIDKNSSGLQKAIYNSCLDLTNGGGKTVELKLSDYFDYYPVKVEFTPHYRNMADDDLSARIARIQQKFENSIKVRVSDDVYIKVACSVNKASDGDISVVYGGMDVKGTALPVSASYEFVTEDYKGCLAIPSAGVYAFSIDQNSVENSHINKVLDVSDGDSVETYPLFDGRHTLIFSLDNSSNCKVSLWDSISESFCSEITNKYTNHTSVAHEAGMQLVTNAFYPVMLDEEDYLVVGSPDFFIVFDKTSDGEYKLGTCLTDLQKGAQKDIWFSVFSERWDLAWRPNWLFYKPTMFLDYQNGKLLLVKTDLCEEAEKATAHTFQLDNKYYEITPDILTVVISGNELEYAGKFVPNIVSSAGYRELNAYEGSGIDSIINDMSCVDPQSHFWL